ncbi:PAS domain S-box protein [Halobacterium litoreum]|uniref:histidine kinase n=1 Tax=Halobacterium litoreum TaxID=2039234 RepID=A0ABD5NH35_9EURY|nr:PAS domain S-box protein [Halobacterium litoreum]UHH12830.1 PAS domain S-box protein [Halobacterium litoreum]
MPSVIRVLHVEDDPGFADLAATFLEREDDRLDVATEHRPEDALDRLEDEQFACVVSDYDLPGRDGIEFLEAVREDYPDLPFVLFTGKGSEEVASDAISAGATDYLQKETGTEQYALLANRVVNAVDQHESRTSYREIFEKAADGIFLHDPETGRINDVNPKAAKMLGYEREELTAMDVGEFSADSPEFSQDEARDRVRAAVEEGPQTFEWLFESKDGEEFWIEVHLKRADIDGRAQVIAMTRDVSERKERARRLQSQKEKVEALHRVATDIEASEDRSDVYDLVLAAAEDILDYDRGIVDTVDGDRLVPVAIPEGVPEAEYHESIPVDADDSLAARAYRTGDAIVVDDVSSVDVAPADPTYRSALTVPITGYGVFQAVARERGAFGETDRELTELVATHARETLTRLEREAELREYAAELERQNERLDEFASIVSHDLRGPLNVASGRVALERDARDSDDLDIAVDALDRMDRIVDRTLTLARDGRAAGDTDRVALEATARRSWSVLDTDGATLDVVGDAAIDADPERLQHLFENLFRNSVEHGSTNGESVTVTVGATDDGFFVADDGPGIPAEERDTVFDRGHTTDEDGTGIGLAIVEEIADAHDWNVTISESDSGGARFDVTGLCDE